MASRNPIKVRQSGRGLSFSVRVKPSAGKSGLTGVSDGAVKIDLKSPAQDGKANKELLKLLSKTFHAKTDAVEILTGATSKSKAVRITGLTPRQFEKALSELKLSDSISVEVADSDTGE